MNRTLLVVLVVICQTHLVEAQRRPLTGVSLTTIPHKPTTFETRTDSLGRTTRYAVDGRITAAPGADSFFVTWMGYDGVQQRTVYEPRTKIIPVIESAVSFDSASRLYTYTYRFSNKIRSSVSAMRTTVTAGNLGDAVAKAIELLTQVQPERSPAILSEGRALLEFGLARVQRALGRQR